MLGASSLSGKKEAGPYTVMYVESAFGLFYSRRQSCKTNKKVCAFKTEMQVCTVENHKKRYSEWKCFAAYLERKKDFYF